MGLGSGCIQQCKKRKLYQSISELCHFHGTVPLQMAHFSLRTCITSARQYFSHVMRRMKDQPSVCSRPSNRLITSWLIIWLITNKQPTAEKSFQKLNGLHANYSTTSDFYERRLMALHFFSRLFFVNFRKSFSDFEIVFIASLTTTVIFMPLSSGNSFRNRLTPR